MSGNLQVERLLNELVERLSSRLCLTPSLAKQLLHSHNWALDSVIQKYLEDASQLLIASRLKPDKTPAHLPNKGVPTKSLVCPICIILLPRDVFCGLGCSHLFCKSCWNAYLETQVMHGVSTCEFHLHGFHICLL